MPDPVWVVGSGGLLGQGLSTELKARGHDVLTSAIPWNDPESAKDALNTGALELKSLARGGPWIVAWCAGAGVTGTSQAKLDQELEVLSSALGSIREHLCGNRDRRGRFFLASSAGGVYAGSPNPPYTESSPTQPLSPYGHAKLAAEAAVTEFSISTGTRGFVARIANLYGPGQNLNKPQGLISVLAKAHLSGQPVSVYVSLDTLRDYIYIDDASRLLVDCLERLDQEHGEAGRVITKIIASQRSDTIGALIGACKVVFKRRPKIVLGASPFAKAQAHDLRLRSIVWEDLDMRPITPLSVGIDATVRSMQISRGHSGF